MLLLNATQLNCIEINNTQPTVSKYRTEFNWKILLQRRVECLTDDLRWSVLCRSESGLPASTVSQVQDHPRAARRHDRSPRRPARRALLYLARINRDPQRRHRHGYSRSVAVMWSETVRLRLVWDQKIGLGLGIAHCGFGFGLGLAGLMLCCETRSCHARRHNDLEEHSNFSSTIYSFSILCSEHHYCGDQQSRSPA